jgi:hypothetical protein
MFRVVSVVALSAMVLGLSSCARMAANQAAEQQAMDQADDARCRSYGALPGSNGYLACRMNIANGRQAAQIASDASYDDLANQMVLRSLPGH